jgi:hypothetical protein
VIRCDWEDDTECGAETGNYSGWCDDHEAVVAAEMPALALPTSARWVQIARAGDELLARLEGTQ